MRTDFKLYKVDIKYIRNLQKIDDKVLSVSPQTRKDNRNFFYFIGTSSDTIHIQSFSIDLGL